MVYGINIYVPTFPLRSCTFITTFVFIIAVTTTALKLFDADQSTVVKVDGCDSWCRSSEGSKKSNNCEELHGWS